MKKYYLHYIILTVIVLIFAALQLLWGSGAVSFSESLHALLSGAGDGGDVVAGIVWSIRLPRMLAAAFLGGALAVSGFLLQTFFSNPLAGPFVLGISSGAKLVVALTMVFCLTRGAELGSFAMIFAAFFGSMLSLCIVLLFAGRVKRMSALIICGVMIGYICSAVTDLVVTFADDTNIVNLHNWSLGSFAGVSFANLRAAFLLIALAMCALSFLAKPMDAYRLGEAYAQSVGVRLPVFRVTLLLLAGLLSACVTAFAGPISFVGIAVPQVMRRLFRTEKTLVMLPACFLGGAVCCLCCDLFARQLFAPAELSVSTVTALLGAPVVLRVMVTRYRAGRSTA